MNRSRTKAEPKDAKQNEVGCWLGRIQQLKHYLVADSWHRPSCASVLERSQPREHLIHFLARETVESCQKFPAAVI